MVTVRLAANRLGGRRASLLSIIIVVVVVITGRSGGGGSSITASRARALAVPLIITDSATLVPSQDIPCCSGRDLPVDTVGLAADGLGGRRASLLLVILVIIVSGGGGGRGAIFSRARTLAVPESPFVRNRWFILVYHKCTHQWSP